VILTFLTFAIAKSEILIEFLTFAIAKSEILIEFLTFAIAKSEILKFQISLNETKLFQSTFKSTKKQKQKSTQYIETEQKQSII
jgi:hypothetical protein